MGIKLDRQEQPARFSRIFAILVCSEISGHKRLLSQEDWHFDHIDLLDNGNLEERCYLYQATGLL